MFMECWDTEEESRGESRIRLDEVLLDRASLVFTLSFLLLLLLILAAAVVVIAVAVIAALVAMISTLQVLSPFQQKLLHQRTLRYIIDIIIQTEGMNKNNRFDIR